MARRLWAGAPWPPIARRARLRLKAAPRRRLRAASQPHAGTGNRALRPEANRQWSEATAAIFPPHPASPRRNAPTHKLSRAGSKRRDPARVLPAPRAQAAPAHRQGGSRRSAAWGQETTPARSVRPHPPHLSRNPPRARRRLKTRQAHAPVSGCGAPHRAPGDNPKRRSQIRARAPPNRFGSQNRIGLSRRARRRRLKASQRGRLARARLMAQTAAQFNQGERMRTARPRSRLA